MKGLKLVDRRLGFPAGVCMIIEIVFVDNQFQIAVTDLYAGTKSYWETGDGERVTFNTHEEAEACLDRYLDIFTTLELSPYPPIPF